jgi:hypothetical protein
MTRVLALPSAAPPRRGYKVVFSDYNWALNAR